MWNTRASSMCCSRSFATRRACRHSCWPATGCSSPTRRPSSGACVPRTPDASGDSGSVAALADEARAFLAAQPWVARVHNVTPVFAKHRVLGVFRCALIPSQPDADVMVWVVVGDIPTAYIAHEPGDSWQDALFGYVDEMERWIAA